MFGRHGAHKHHDTMGEVSVNSTTYIYIIYESNISLLLFIDSSR